MAGFRCISWDNPPRNSKQDRKLYRAGMRHIYMSEQYVREDAFLVNRVLAGNHEAFSILIGRYGASVERLCVRLVSSDEALIHGAWLLVVG